MQLLICLANVDGGAQHLQSARPGAAFYSPTRSGGAAAANSKPSSEEEEEAPGGLLISSEMRSAHCWLISSLKVPLFSNTCVFRVTSRRETSGGITCYFHERETLCSLQLGGKCGEYGVNQPNGVGKQQQVENPSVRNENDFSIREENLLP